MKAAGIFKRHHSDTKCIGYQSQKIMDEATTKFELRKHAPVLHCPRQGYLSVIVVANCTLDPYELVNKSWILKDPQYQETMENAVRALAKKSCSNRRLRDILDHEAFQSGLLDKQTITKELIWMIQNSSKWTVLKLFGV